MYEKEKRKMTYTVIILLYFSSQLDLLKQRKKN